MKLLFWLEGNDAEFFQSSAMRLEQMYGEIDMESFTSGNATDSCMAGGRTLKFIPKENVKEEAYDVLLVVGKAATRERVLHEVRSLGLDDSKVLFDFEVMLPGFTIEKANRLHRSRSSIFSINGWGRRLYQRFRLPYLSPFIESVMTTEDWLTFLQAPQAHLSRELIYHEKIGTADGREFPVFRMGEEGLKVYFLYETDVKKIRRDWPERVKGINWGDLLLMMYTETPEYLDRFDRLPYGKKVCFTSFESRLDSAFYLPPEQDEEGENLPLWASVEKLAETEKPYYDLWDLLLYGKRTEAAQK